MRLMLMPILGMFLLAVPGAAAERPNVVLIYADDQGSVDAGCYGAKDLQTPHLDRLADSGVRFSQMYAPAPVCSASRVGLLTGRYPVRAGQPGNGPLDSSEVTIAEQFRDSGYATGHVGKWHLGDSPQQRPGGQGFASSFGHMQGCIDNYSHFFFWNGPNRHDLWRNGVEVFEDGAYFPDLMVRECKAFIDASREQPFLLYWAINAPHYPYQGTDRWREAYQDLPHPRDKYAAFVSSMDERIGEVLDHLEQAGLRESTIVVFQSDHGHSTETRAFGGGGDSGPYRGAKFSLFEGGIRVPAIVSWPGKVPTGEVRREMVTGCDWLPTLCQWCDVPLPERKLDGRSIAAVIESPQTPTPHEVFQWQFGGGRGAQWAVRRGPWKLIGNPVDTSSPQTDREKGGRLEEPLFLANVELDPSETKNLAAEHVDIVERLQADRARLVEELSPER